MENWHQHQISVYGTLSTTQDRENSAQRWQDMFNWQLITHITRAHGQIHTQLFINMTNTMMK